MVLAERDEALKKRDHDIPTPQRIAPTTLNYGAEAFQNILEQVVVLNLGVHLRTREANIDWNAQGGVLVEYNADRYKHEVRFIPRVVDDSEAANAPDV